MKITRINRIQRHRIFHDFTWPADLPEFARFNLIYGWNGSGKTTLSSLLRHLQNRTAVTEGDIQFEVDGRPLAGNTVDTSPVPAVRVFDRDCVEKTVRANADALDPIYFLGLDSIERQQQLEELRRTLATVNADTDTAQATAEAAERTIDRFRIDKASLIKGALTSAKFTKYNNHDKRNFRRAVEALTVDTYRNHLRDEKQKEEFLLQKEAQMLDAVPLLSYERPALNGRTTARLREFLTRRVASRALDELAAYPDVARWVQRGLDLHTGTHQANTCRFCGQALSADRRECLEAHFNDAFVAFQRTLADEIRSLSSMRVQLDGIRFIDESRLYQHLRGDYVQAVSRAREVVADSVEQLRAIEAALERKKGTPFEEVAWPGQATVPETGGWLSTELESVNSVLRKHNEMTTEFQATMESACSALEMSYVAEAFLEYKEKVDAITAAQVAIQELTARAGELERQIAGMERDIVEHRRPADELNRELRAYLGHDQLTIAVRDTGYSITRAGQPATHLSEGEKTAITFLYFLKSLQAKDFDLTKSVVVIDDPVSSLDASALFSAFGYMKERVKDTGQLFVLTHNFSFFRQVRNWFHHLRGQDRRQQRFYFLTAYSSDGRRLARIGQLDSLLREYQSEYHYLFKLLKTEADRPDGDVALERLYGVPNIARRLLESFLAFRHPDARTLYDRVQLIDFDRERKVRIIRLVETYSHSDSLDDPGHDPTLLTETRLVVRDVLALIQASDPAHHAAMMALLAKHDRPDNEDDSAAGAPPAVEPA